METPQPDIKPSGQQIEVYIEDTAPNSFVKIDGKEIMGVNRIVTSLVAGELSQIVITFKPTGASRQKAKIVGRIISEEQHMQYLRLKEKYGEETRIENGGK